MPADAPLRVAESVTLAPARQVSAQDRTRVQAILAYCRRNPSILIGSGLLLSLLVISVIGPLAIDTKEAEPLSAFPALPPSWDYPLGTDNHGRNLLAVIVSGLPSTLQIGFLAGAIGLGLGTVLGFLSGYLGGVLDAVVRLLVDALITVPGLLVLVTIAASLQTFISVTTMALIIASLSWRYPTRIIRAQVLTMRERGYIQVARRNGMNTAEIIFREMLPNLMPFLAASFVAAVSGAILFSVGLEALGLGPQNEPTLGMTIYWSIRFNAMLQGMWWWWLPPIVLLVVLFLGLLLVSMGLDEVANPRMRRSA